MMKNLTEGNYIRKRKKILRKKSIDENEPKNKKKNKKKKQQKIKK